MLPIKKCLYNNKDYRIVLAIIVFLVFTLVLLNIFDKGNTLSYIDKLESLIKKTISVPNFDFSNLRWVSNATTSTVWTARDSHAAFVFKDKMWVLGGLDANNAIENGEPNYDKAIYFNDVWNTTDGLNWTRAIEHTNFPLIRSTSVFEVKGKLFMLGGYSPDTKVGYDIGLWTSNDGIIWTKEKTKLPWVEREGQKVINFKDKYYMIGGVNYLSKERFNDVWVSTDGYTWSLATSNAGWQPRWDMEISEFNGKLWLTGGMTSAVKTFGDEWVSNDGIKWSLVYKDAPYGHKQGHTSAVSNGSLMIISGLDDNNTSTGEVWETKDGIHWTKQITNWSAREDVSVLVFKNRIWILGGMNYDYHWTNNIYFSDYNYFDGSTINSQTFTENTGKIDLYPNTCPSTTSTISSQDLSETFVSRDERLPNGFVPSNLVDLNGLVKTDGDVCLDNLAAQNLIMMFNQAKKDNVLLSINFGYRSPEKQQEMFDFYAKQSSPEDASEGIAKPYYSEHQLGMAADLSAKSINYLGVSTKFAKTEEYKWLENNAYLYGYTLSYPENKRDVTGYKFEPWHYRYVGQQTAKILHDKNITFSEYINNQKVAD